MPGFNGLLRLLPAPGLLAALSSIASLLISVALPALAAESGATPTPPAAPALKVVAPGVEFTKIQTLDPESRGTNRPIKQKWAVVIGTSKFKEGRLAPGIEGGDMAQSAKDFYDYLIDPHGGRFDKEHVKLLVDAGSPRQSIMTALGSSFLGNAAKPDDLVVVYIATSAFPTTDGNTYLCAYDCALDNIYATCISMQTLMKTLKENVHCDRIVLVLQAAYSGAASLEGAKPSHAPEEQPNFNLDVQKVVTGSGLIILSSSQPNEITWGSSFSKNLIEALRKEDGMITLNKAFAAAKQKTSTETAAVDSKKRQVPTMKSTWTGSDLVLGALPAERVPNLPAALTSFLSAEGSYLKANTLIGAGKTDEAIEQYKLALVADPKYADALADYGVALTIKGDWKSAADMCKRAIAVRPDDELFHLNYARVLDQLGENDASMQELNTAYRLNPKDTSVLLALSHKNMAAGNAESSVRFLEEAVDLYPARADFRERLSHALMKSGDAEQAVAQAKEAVRLDAKSASAQTTLGTLLMVQGYVVPAVDAYKEAAKLAPRDPNVHWLLSQSLEKSGDRDGAIAELTYFLQVCSPSDPHGEKAKTHLQELKALVR